MEREIEYEDVEWSNDVALLVEYCKQGAIDNNSVNKAKFSDWLDAEALISVYLDHNGVMTNSTFAEVVRILDGWLLEQKHLEKVDKSEDK